MNTAVYCFILMVYLLDRTCGLECIHCADIVFDTSTITDQERFSLGNFQNTFHTPECANEHPNRAAKGIYVKNCTDVSLGEKVHKCGHFSGNLNIIGSDQSNFKVHANIRGCFAVDKQKTNRCDNNKATLGRQTAVLSKFLNLDDDFSSLSITEINGVLCTNGVKGTNKSQSSTIRLNLLLLLLITVLTYL